MDAFTDIQFCANIITLFLAGDSRVVVGPAENSNVINNQESLKIKIITNRKRRMSSDTPSSSPSYSSSLSPGSRVGESGSVKKWSGEGTSIKNRLHEAGTNGKRGRGVRTRGRARGRGGEGRGGGRGARGLHDWENSRTWVCAICGQYDPVAAAGATTEWIGCDCNRWILTHFGKLKTETLFQVVSQILYKTEVCGGRFQLWAGSQGLLVQLAPAETIWV